MNATVRRGGHDGAVARKWTQWLDDTVYRVDAADRLTKAIFSVRPEDRLPVLELLLEHLEPELPGVPLGRPLAEAREWAAWASLPQRKALTLACFESLPERDRRAFVDYVLKEHAAPP